MGFEDLVRASNTYRDQSGNVTQQSGGGGVGSGTRSTGRWGVPTSYQNMKDMYDKLSTAKDTVKLETPPEEEKEKEYGTHEANQADQFAWTAGEIADSIMGVPGDYFKSWDEGDYLKAAGQFAASLPLGILASPFSAVENLYQAATGTDLDSYNEKTGEISDKELSGMQRLGNLGVGAIDAMGVFGGGSKEVLKTGANLAMKAVTGNTLKDAFGGVVTREGGNFVKQVASDVAEEGIEEGVQQGFQDMADDNLNEGTWGRMAQAAGLGALGGGVMSAGFGGINRGIAKLSGQDNVLGFNKDKGAVSGASSGNSGQVIAPSTQTHDAEYFTPVKGLYGSADEDLIADAVELQAKTYREPGATSSKVLVGNFDIEIDKAQLSARDLKTLYDSDEQGAQYLFDSLNYGRKSQGKPALDRAEFDKAFSVDRSVIADSINQYLKDNNASFTLSALRNPKTNNVSDVRLECDHVNSGGGIIVNPALMPYTNGDYDGDAFVQLFNPENLRLANSPLDVFFDSRPIDGEHRSQTNFSWSDSGISLSSRTFGKKSNKKPGDVYRAFQDAGLDPSWFHSFQKAWGGGSKHKDKDQWQFDTLELFRKIRVQEHTGRFKEGTVAKLIQNLQKYTSGDLAIEQAKQYYHDGVDQQNYSVQTGYLAKALSEVVPYEKGRTEKSLNRRSRKDKLTQTLAQIATIMGKCEIVCDTTTNPFMRGSQAATQGSDIAEIINKLDSEMNKVQGPHKDQFRLMLAYALQRLDLSSEPITQIEGVFRSVVKSNTLIKCPPKDENRLGRGKTVEEETQFMKDFFTAFKSAHGEMKSVYNEALETLTYEGLDIDPAYHEKIDLDNETKTLYAFMQIFGDADASWFFAGLEGTMFEGDTINGMVEKLSSADNATGFGVLSENSKTSADFALKLVETYNRTGFMKGSRLETYVKTFVSESNWLKQDGDSLPKYEGSNILKMEARFRILEKLIGPNGFLELGIVNVESALASPWGKYMFSNDPDKVLNFIVSFGQFSKWRGVVEEYINGNYEQARANATAMFNVSPLDDFILSEMQEYLSVDDTRAFDSLFNIIDPEVPLYDKKRMFDLWADAEFPASFKPSIFENALKTRDSELGEGEVGEKIRKSRAITASAITLDTSDDVAAWSKLYNSTIDNAITETDLLHAINYQLSHGAAKLNENWYGAIFSEGATLNKESGQKSMAIETASLMYQQLHLQGDGRPSSVIQKMTGPNSGSFTSKQLSQRLDVIANMLSDKNFEVMVSEDGNVCPANRDAIFALAGIELNGNDPTLAHYDQLFRTFPQFLSLLCNRTYDLMPNSRSTVIETREPGGLEQHLRGAIGKIGQDHAVDIENTTNKIKRLVMDDVETPMVICGMIGAKYKDDPIEIERIVANPKRMKDEAVAALNEYVTFLRMSAVKSNEYSLVRSKRLQEERNNVYSMIWDFAIDIKRIESDTKEVTDVYSERIKQGAANINKAYQVVKEYNKEYGSKVKMPKSGKEKIEIDPDPYLFLIDVINTIAPPDEIGKNSTDVKFSDPQDAKVSQYVFDLLHDDIRDQLSKSGKDSSDAAIDRWIDNYMKNQQVAGSGAKALADSTKKFDLAISEEIILEATRPDNPKFDRLAKAIGRIYRSPYCGEKGMAEVHDKPEDFEEIMKKNPLKWSTMIRREANQWNSEVLNYALLPFSTEYNTTRNYNFYGVTTQAYDIMDSMVSTVSDLGLWNPYTKTESIKVPEIDFSNGALTYIAGNTQSAMESAGNSVNSGVEGGVFKFYYLWGAAGRNTFCTAEPDVMTIDQLLNVIKSDPSKMNMVNYVDPADESKDEIVSVDQRTFDRLSREAANDPKFGQTKIKVYDYEKCHWGCRHHTKQSVTGRNRDMINPLGKMLIDLVYQSSEDHVLKRKKTIGRFSHVLSSLTDNTVDKRIQKTTFTYTKDELYAGLVKYRSDVAKWFHQELKNEQLDGYSLNDCLMLSQFLCRRVMLDFGGGDRVSVNFSQLQDPNFNLDDITQGRDILDAKVFSLGIEGEMELATQAFLRKNRMAGKKLDAMDLELLLKDVLEDDLVSISDKPLKSMIDRFVPVKTSYRRISPFVSTAASPAQEFISAAYRNFNDNVLSSYNGKQELVMTEVFGTADTDRINRLNRDLDFQTNSGSGKLIAVTGFTHNSWKQLQSNKESQKYASDMQELSSYDGRSVNTRLGNESLSYVLVFRDKGEPIESYEKKVSRQIKRYENTGIRLLVSGNVSLDDPSIAMTMVKDDMALVDGEPFAILDTMKLHKEQYPIMAKTGTHEEDPSQIAIWTIGGAYSQEEVADSGGKIHVNASVWDNNVIKIDDRFIESSSFLPDDLKGKTAHIVTREELADLDFDAMKQNRQIAHYKYPEGRNAPLGKDKKKAQERTEELVEDFINNLASKDVSARGYRTSADQDDVIALVRYGNGPTATYVPIIASASHPVHMDNLVVSINPMNASEPMINYHIEIKPSEFLGVKTILTVFDWKSYMRAGDNEVNVTPAYELGYNDNEGNVRHSNITGTMSYETAKSRDANMKHQTMGHILLKGKQLLPSSAFAVRDPKTNEWMFNKPGIIRLDEKLWRTIGDINVDATSAMRTALMNPFGIADDRHLSIALAQFFKNCLANDIHPAAIMSNIALEYESSVSSTGEIKYKARSFYQTAPAGAVLNGMTRAQILKFFHLINPNLCPNGDDINALAGKHKTLFDNHGNMLVNDDKGNLRYQRVHLEEIALKRENTDIGHQTEDGTLGTQMFMNSLVEQGLENLTKSQVARYIDTLQIQSGDLSGFKIGEKFARDLSIDMNDYDFVPLSKRARIAYHKEVIYSKDYYNKLFKEGFATYNHIRPILDDLVDRKATDQEKIDNLYRKFYKELKIPGTPNPVVIHGIVNRYYGYSYNEGRGETAISFKDFKTAVEGYISNMKNLDTAGFPVPARRYDGRISVPVGPKALMDWEYKVAHDGGFTAMSREAWDEKMREEVQAALTDISHIKQKKRKLSLQMITNFGCVQNGFEDIFGRMGLDISYDDIENTQSSFLRSCGSVSPDAMVNQEILRQQAKQARTDLERAYAAAEFSDVPDASSPNGMATAYLGPQMTGYRKVANNITLLARAQALLDPLIAASSFVSRPAHAMGTKAVLFLDSAGVKTVGGKRGFVLDQRVLHNQAKDESTKICWQALNDMQRLGLNEAAIINGLGDPESFKQMIDDKLKQGGWINRAANKVFKFSSASGAFTNMQIENFFNFVAQNADPNTMPALFAEVPNSDGQNYMQWAIATKPAEFMAELMDPDKPFWLLGQRARNFALEGDLAQQTCFSIILQHWFHNKPVHEMLFTMGLCKFPMYAYNVSGWFLKHVMPVSTLTYVGREWLINRGVFPDLHLERTQVVPDLKTALIKDACTLGISLLAGLLASFFVEPPEDDDLWGNVNEWTVMGMRVDESWWIQDIIGAPLAMACALKSAELGHPRLDIIPNWLSHAMYSNPMMRVGDLISAFLEPDETKFANQVEEAERMADLNGGKPTDQDVFMTGITTFGMNFVGSLITPSFVKQVYQSNFLQPDEKSYKKVQALDEYGNVIPDELMKTNYMDQQIRKITRDNPVWAFIMNTVTGSWNDPRKTGYLAQQMPYTVYWDDSTMFYLDHYGVTRKNEETGEIENKSVEECRAIAYEVIGLLQTYTVDELVDDGFCLSSDTRRYVSATLWDCIHYLDEQYNAWIDETGMDAKVVGEGDWAEGQRIIAQTKESYYSDRQGIMNIYNALWSKEFSESWQAYHRYNTTYQQDDNGEWYATGFKNYYGSPILVAPGTLEDDQGTLGYEGNWETPSPVTGRSAGGRALVPQQMDIGEVPSIESFSADGNGEEFSGAFADLTSMFDPKEAVRGKYDDDYANNGYPYGYGYRRGGGGGYRRGGGGGGYDPKLYSRSPQLNVYEPANLQTSARYYSPNFDYLRPNVEKQGSRDAYARSEI